MRESTKVDSRRSVEETGAQRARRWRSSRRARSVRPGVRPRADGRNVAARSRLRDRHRVDQQAVKSASHHVAGERGQSVDRRSAWQGLPSLTRAKDVTPAQAVLDDVRLSVLARGNMFMRRCAAARRAADPRRVAMKPWTYEPGTKWQYSNTNYVVAGVIARTDSGMRLHRFPAGAILAFGHLVGGETRSGGAADAGSGRTTAPMRSRLRRRRRRREGWMSRTRDRHEERDMARWDI